MERLRVATHVCLCAIIVVLAANAVRLALPRLRAQTTTVVPYTVVLSETIIRSDGQRRQGPHQLWATRSDGSVVLKFGGADTGSRQIRFASGRKVETNDKLRAKSTTRPPLNDSWVLDSRERCAKTITGFRRSNQDTPVDDVVRGYRAVRIRRGASTRWHAMDYGCALLRQRVDFGDQGASELELVTLIAGEPNATLFAVAKDYREGPPSSLTPVNCDGACGEQQKAHFARLDASYYAHRDH